MAGVRAHGRCDRSEKETIPVVGLIHSVCAQLWVENSCEGPGVYISPNWADTRVAAGMRSAKKVLVAGKRGLAILGPPLSALLKWGSGPQPHSGRESTTPRTAAPSDSTPGLTAGLRSFLARAKAAAQRGVSSSGASRPFASRRSTAV